MNKVYAKSIFRTIRQSFGRYFAIMSIIALGVGFFAGLKVTKPGMIQTGNTYMQEHNMYDFKLMSTMGFDEGAIDELAKKEYVSDVNGAIYQDFLYVENGGTSKVLRANSITENVNTLELKEGRMPIADNECVVDAYQFGKQDIIGQEIVIDEKNDDVIKNMFAHKSYKVVGIVNSPLYINIERGTTSLGNGRIAAFIYIPKDGFAVDYYKEIYVRLQDCYEIYSHDYEDYIEEITPIIEKDVENYVTDKYEEMLQLGYPVDKPEIYVLDRNTNVGYMCYDNDTNIVEGVARVFPVFFFLIAALVCSTTMTRMVDDERGQIGTYRALGYSNGAIMMKYLLYSGSSALLGCIVGFFGGSYLFPYVISEAYRMLYDFGDGVEFYFSPLLLVICLAVSLLCSMGTAYFACRNELRCMPATLVRPKAPAAGKRIFLEYISFIWKPMKFLHKVTARNVFRFKKRMFMMLLGISGCTALVLTGLGIKDSVSNLANFQYGDIDIYDMEITLKSGVDTKILEEKVNDIISEGYEEATSIMKSTVEYRQDTYVKTVYLVVADEEELNNFVNFKMTQETGKYPEKGEVLLSNKIAEIAGVQVGDEITLNVDDICAATLKVSGIFENYVWHYAYVTPETYEDYFNRKYEKNVMYINVASDEAAYEAGTNLVGLDEIINVSVVAEIKDRVLNMMSMLDAVVGLVIGCAGALAFIVLFNLSNINVTERVREIATIKVLGFYPRETGSYVFRENFVLTLMGIVVGLPLGVLLHSFVMSQIQVDMVSFAKKINSISYAYTVVIVVFFLIIVDLVMRRKIEKIHMAESLKSIE